MADTNHCVSGNINHLDRSDAMDEYLDQFMEDHLNGRYGNILDQLNAEDECSEEYPDALDGPWDGILAQQELEDYEQADEYFGYFGGDDGW